MSKINEDYKQLIYLLSSYLSDEEIEKVEKSFNFAESAHHGQMRVSGEPYILHPLEVAKILGDLRMDADTIVSAILHDVLEDTPIPKHDIENLFGHKVAELVDGVSKLQKIKFTSKEEAQAENFRKMLIATAKDVRVIIVKLADRLHNMRTLDSLARPKQKRIAKETLEIYAPIANRLGMHKLCIELEDLCFRHIYPIRYKVLATSLEKNKARKQNLIEDIKKAILSKLKLSGINVVNILGREKHLYSLYCKMKRKDLSVSDVMDIYALRVVTFKKDDCYKTLGVVHSMFRPVPGRFKDYIALPKLNGYQSLHTTVIGADGIPIEVQIRTDEMDRNAETGIASHWLYKTTSNHNQNIWLQNIAELEGKPISSQEFLQSMKKDLTPKQIYVFTQKGEILPLPYGSTPIDFAYALHTDLGNRCIAAKVDRKFVPLSSKLFTGNSVEIIVNPNAYPNPVWLTFVVTGKAKASIKHWLKNQQHEDAVELGERIFKNFLKTYKQNYSEEAITQIAVEMGYSGIKELFKNIGLGVVKSNMVAQKFVQLNIGNNTVNNLTNDSLFTIQGNEGSLIEYCKHCYPVPGDRVIGEINTTKGVIAHRVKCLYLSKKDGMPESIVPLCWSKDVKGHFIAKVCATVINKMGVLAKITNIFSGLESDIDNILVDKADERLNVLIFMIKVKGRKHLSKIFDKIQSLDEVLNIKRL